APPRRPPSHRAREPQTKIAAEHALLPVRELEVGAEVLSAAPQTNVCVKRGLPHDPQVDAFDRAPDHDGVHAPGVQGQVRLAYLGRLDLEIAPSRKIG